MADVIVATETAQNEVGSNRMVAVDRDRAIYIYTEPGVGGDLFFSETANAGTSWTAAQVIATIPFPENVSVWYDRWGRTNAGQKIHIAYTHDGAGVGLFYARLDVSGFTAVNVGSLEIDATLSIAPNLANDRVQICEIPDGAGGFVLYIMYHENNATGRFVIYKSTDGGAVWTNVYDEEGAAAVMGSHDISDISHIRMIPGPGAFSETSPWFLCSSVTEQEVFVAVLTGGLLVPTTIASDALGDGDMDFVTSRENLACCQRHTDGKVFIAFFADNTTADNELQLWSLTEVNSALRGTNPLSAPITDQAGGVNMCIDQSLGSILVCYLRGTDNDNMKAFHQISINGGDDWVGGELAQQADAEADMEVIDCPMSTPGTGEGRFQVVWWDDTTNNYYSSDTNNVILGGYRINAGGPGSDSVDCQVGMALGGGDALGLRKGYGNYQDEGGATWVNLIAFKTGSLTEGDVVEGVTSGATGVFVAWGALLDRMLLGSVRTGAKSKSGTPFLPNEVIRKTSDHSISVIVATNPTASVIDTVTDAADST